jgi:SAM-dependent methyltransferase
MSRQFPVITGPNPFENQVVAAQWIKSIENEKGLLRDTKIYPRLLAWFQNLESGLVVEIGSGQGICSDKLGEIRGKYIGIEPSTILVDRATELYQNDQREFIVGNAYSLPIESGVANGSFSVMVWFHLEDIATASQELFRILKPGGKFMIITANPDAMQTWESFYFDHTIEGNVMKGKVNVPGNPMSESIFYRHTSSETYKAIRSAGLNISHTSQFGVLKDEPIFLSVEGHRT